MNYLPKTSNTLQRLLKERNIHPTTFANAIGKTRQTVYLWLNNKSQPQGKALRKKIADYLSAPLEEVFYDPSYLSVRNAKNQLVFQIVLNGEVYFRDPQTGQMKMVEVDEDIATAFTFVITELTGNTPEHFISYLINKYGHNTTTEGSEGGKGQAE